MRLVADFVVS